MSEETDDIDKWNRISNLAYTWGMVAFAVFAIGLLVKMFVSAM